MCICTTGCVRLIWKAKLCTAAGEKAPGPGFVTDDGTERIQPDADPADSDAISGAICMTIGYGVNTIYECQNKHQLIKYYHAALCRVPTSTHTGHCSTEGLTQGTTRADGGSN